MATEESKVDDKAGEINEEQLKQKIKARAQNKFEKFIPRKCDYCDKEYTPQRAWQKFCKVNCRVKYANTRRDILANEETRKEVTR